MSVVLSESQRRKSTGTYYTSNAVAQFLVSAIAISPLDRVLEPCFGEGVFIDAWRRRTVGQGQLVGCDIAGDVVQNGRARYPETDLRHVDFFDVRPGSFGTFTAVVGNPPFVRYQRFQGDLREKALNCAQSAGVCLTSLSSAWVPFLIHAAQQLHVGGRMAVVAPMEITYAKYARPFLQFLGKNFGSIRIVSFNEPLFPDLSESTVLLLAKDWGRRSTGIDLIHANTLDELQAEEIWFHPARHVQLGQWENEGTRSQRFRISREAEDLYETVSRMVPTLDDLARLTIGYVTGNNTWFHLDRQAVVQRDLQDDVRLVVRRHADLGSVGLAINLDDLERWAGHGAHWLFVPREPLSPAARRYVAEGEEQGIPNAYKCRVRAPWWKVPGVASHDFMVGVLSSSGPRVIGSMIPATNSLLVGTLKTNVDVRILAAASITSLSSLSAEIVGHALGGGALKLEPSEARRWSLPVNQAPDEAALLAIDDHLRLGRHDEAVGIANDVFLKRGLGLSAHDVNILDEALLTLRRQRTKSP